MPVLDPIPLEETGVEDRSVVFGPFPQDPQDGRRYLRNISQPSLTPYLPDPARATGTGIVIAPGGAMHFLSIDNEGVWVAERLVEMGIAAFVLHYRVAQTPSAGPDLDAAFLRATVDRDYLHGVGVEWRDSVVREGGAAIELIRARAAEWRIASDRVGMIGFSAGGFITAVTAADAPEASRPSFAAGIYPALWGDVVVPTPAPPLFLAWATDDEGQDLIVGSALRLYQLWWRAGASVEAHGYASGGHGFGITRRDTASDRWFTDFTAWLARCGY